MSAPTAAGSNVKCNIRLLQKMYPTHCNGPFREHFGFKVFDATVITNFEHKMFIEMASVVRSGICCK